MLSPLRTTTEPSACFATLPVSREMLWFPTFAETEIASAMCNVLSRGPRPRCALRRLSGLDPGNRGILIAGAKTAFAAPMRVRRGSRVQPLCSKQSRGIFRCPSRILLLADPETVDELAVPGRVLGFEVVEQPPALAYQ